VAVYDGNKQSQSHPVTLQRQYIVLVQSFTLLNGSAGSLLRRKRRLTILFVRSILRRCSEFWSWDMSRSTYHMKVQKKFSSGKLIHFYITV